MPTRHSHDQGRPREKGNEICTFGKKETANVSESKNPTRIIGGFCGGSAPDAEGTKGGFCGGSAP